ncbi:MAG: PAS domain-containing protein [Deltaproteobacteria bacterium]|nr:PAS domain-containing protein [Deltaproteobacteria bacterium]
MGERVILVTDDELLRDKLTRQLLTWGHYPLSATGPDDAINLIADRKPPLAILDNKYKAADALQLLARMKKAGPLTEVIFLVLSKDLERGAQGLELGASDFLVKPVSASRLAIAIKRAQDRLAQKQKLAVLAGHQPEDEVLPFLTALGQQGDQAAACATRLYDTQVRYQSLFDEVPCYISVLDPDHRIVAVNRRFAEDFGERLGEYCYQVNKNRSEPCPGCQVVRTFRDGQSHQFEEVLTALDGVQHHVLTRTAPLRDSRGRITQVMEMSTDITQLRELQNHLADLGLLIGSISHGIKGLLTALDGGMYNLRIGFERHDRGRQFKGWEVVEVMVGRIRRTVLDILYYAKDRGISKDDVEVSWFANQVGINAESSAKKHGIIFEKKVAPDLGTFYVDPDALCPALVNILENAVDACVEDPKKKQHRVQFLVSREVDVIVFDVVDNGMGMDEDTREKMFTLFFTSKGSSGTGLGLFISNDTVHQHGGSITVDSEPGFGSHFHIRIPIRHGAAAPREIGTGPLTPDATPDKAVS